MLPQKTHRPAVQEADAGQGGSVLLHLTSEDGGKTWTPPAPAAFEAARPGLFLRNQVTAGSRISAARR